MPFDANIFSQIDTTSPGKLAQMFDPAVQQQRNLATAQSQEQMAQLQRASKLREVLGGQTSQNPADISQGLAGAGFGKEALDYQQLADAQRQRQESEVARRADTTRKAFGQIAAMGGDSNAVRKTLSQLPWMNPQQVEEAAQAADMIPAEGRQSHFLGLADPQYLVRREESQAKAIESGEQKAADREARAEIEKQRTLDRQAAAAQSEALRRDLAAQGIAARSENAKLIAGMKPEKALTESQGNATLFGARAKEADKVLNEVGGNYSPAALSTKGLVENVPGVSAVANALMGANEQKVDQAQRNFINAVLRKESGAAISPGEFASAKKQYFPEVGDKPEKLAQKAQNRTTAIQGLRMMSGEGAARMDAATQKAGQQPSAGGFKYLGKE